MARKLMKGTEVIAEAALAANIDGYFGYPITPQNEVGEYLSPRLIEAGKAFVQAESETAAANMAFGAAASGARVLTSSSSPGIALKQEAISYMAGAELPVVIISVSRSGPGLGGILPSQADYFQSTRGGGNGDYNPFVIAPATLQEMADCTIEAFRVAEKYKRPAIVLSDGMIAQMMEPVDLSGLKLPPKSKEGFATGKGTRKEKNVVTSLYLNVDHLEQHNWNLEKKWQEMKKNEIKVEEYKMNDAEFAFVAYGSPSRIVKNAIDRLREEGMKVGLFRPIILWPFPYEPLAKSLSKVKRILVAELSRGQMIDDVRLAIKDDSKIAFHGRPGGAIFTVEELVEKARKEFGK